MVFFSRIDLCLYTQKKKCKIILGSTERMSEESCPLPVMIFFFLDLNREIYIAEYLSAVLNCKVEPTPCISLNMEGLEKTHTIVYENLSKFKGEVGNHQNWSNYYLQESIFLLMIHSPNLIRCLYQLLVLLDFVMPLWLDFTLRKACTN
ncbi:hypothetical protein SAY86_008008 [Trapa natans]|uniref:Uncharacterized protein n=1 Tax=Trapa natans TaxID=22666 RepID=A0AAN7QXM2_TRANT|nr:hypothetical protein SAY86_008008 [Trapa natans]